MSNNYNSWSSCAVLFLSSVLSLVFPPRVGKLLVLPSWPSGAIWPNTRHCIWNMIMIISGSKWCYLPPESTYAWFWWAHDIEKMNLDLFELIRSEVPAMLSADLFPACPRSPHWTFWEFKLKALGVYQAPLLCNTWTLISFSSVLRDNQKLCAPKSSVYLIWLLCCHFQIGSYLEGRGGTSC